MKTLGVSKHCRMYEEVLAPGAEPVTIDLGGVVEHPAIVVTGGKVYAEWNDDEISATASHYFDGEFWSMDMECASVTVEPDADNVGNVTVRVQVLEDGD